MPWRSFFYREFFALGNSEYAPPIAAMTIDESNPRQVLEDAHHDTVAGRHEEALQKLLWFHRNALRIDSSLSGVRLSFALAFWMNLADVFPPALDMLVATRDDGAERIKSGEGSSELFREVEAISRRLGELSRVYDLFLFLVGEDVELATDCFPYAEQSLSQHEDWDLFMRFVGDLSERVRARTGRLEQDLRKAAGRKKTDSRLVQRWAAIRNCAQGHILLLRGLRSQHRTDEASRLRRLMVDIIGNEAIREEMDEELSILEAGGPGRFPVHNDQGKIVGFYVPDDDAAP